MYVEYKSPPLEKGRYIFYYMMRRPQKLKNITTATFNGYYSIDEDGRTHGGKLTPVNVFVYTQKSMPCLSGTYKGQIPHYYVRGFDPSLSFIAPTSAFVNTSISIAVKKGNVYINNYKFNFTLPFGWQSDEALFDTKTRQYYFTGNTTFNNFALKSPHYLTESTFYGKFELITANNSKHYGDFSVKVNVSKENIETKDKREELFQELMKRPVIPDLQKSNIFDFKIPLTKENQNPLPFVIAISAVIVIIILWLEHRTKRKKFK